MKYCKARDPSTIPLMSDASQKILMVSIYTSHLDSCTAVDVKSTNKALCSPRQFFSLFGLIV